MNHKKTQEDQQEVNGRHGIIMVQEKKKRTYFTRSPEFCISPDKGRSQKIFCIGGKEIILIIV